MIELYVLVHKTMDIMLNLAKKHVYNTNILHYKMVMEIKDGVVVIMI